MHADRDFEAFLRTSADKAELAVASGCIIHVRNQVDSVVENDRCSFWVWTPAVSDGAGTVRLLIF